MVWCVREGGCGVLGRGGWVWCGVVCEGGEGGCGV